MTGTTTTFHLGDYYDADGQGVQGVIGGVPIKVIHLTVAALWRAPNEETDFISGANYTQRANGSTSASCSCRR